VVDRQRNSALLVVRPIVIFCLKPPCSPRLERSRGATDEISAARGSPSSRRPPVFPKQLSTPDSTGQRVAVGAVPVRRAPSSKLSVG